MTVVNNQSPLPWRRDSSDVRCPPATSFRDHGFRSIVILNGSLGSSTLGRLCGRSVVSFPISRQLTILDIWRQQIEGLDEADPGDVTPIYLLVNPGAPTPIVAQKSSSNLKLVVDSSRYRGTGGSLCDVANRFDDDDFVLVVMGIHYLLEPLASLLRVMAEPRTGCSFLARHDGSPAGLVWIKASLLRGAPKVGYFDFKEQMLPHINDRVDVRVVRTEGMATIPIRTFKNYLTAVEAYQRRRERQTTDDDPFAETWNRTFAIIESGAIVGADAIVHNSVVLHGARVQRGATIVDSLVCSDARVASGEVVNQQLIGFKEYLDLPG